MNLLLEVPKEWLLPRLHRGHRRFPGRKIEQRSTIFFHSDIYKKFINKEASDRKVVCALDRACNLPW